MITIVLYDKCRSLKKKDSYAPNLGLSRKDDQYCAARCQVKKKDSLCL